MQIAQQMLSIIALVMRIAAYWLGDKALSKWIAAWRFWWRKHDDQRLKIMADEEYERMVRDWAELPKDRGPIRP